MSRRRTAFALMALLTGAVVSVFIYIDTRAAPTIIAAATPTETAVPPALTPTAAPLRTSTFAAATATPIALPPSPTLTPFPVPPLPPAILGRPNWSAALLLTPLRHGDTSRAAVYLTFDDGYGFPDQILQVLQQKHVRATACLVGSFVVARRAFVQHWVEAGDTLCNHSYTHAHLVPRTATSDGGYAAAVNELTRTQDLLRQIVPGTPVAPFFRPPYGEQNDVVRHAAASLGYRTITWSLDAQDWRAGLDATYVRDYIVKNARNGDVILLHFERRSTLDALPGIIDGLRARGFDLLGLESLPEGH